MTRCTPTLGHAQYSSSVQQPCRPAASQRGRSRPRSEQIIPI